MDHLCACSEHKLLEPRYRHSLDAAVKIFRNEGASALWLGLPPTLVMAVPATMVCEQAIRRSNVVMFLTHFGS